jgi:FlaA1/EpsC-like NDP-sugar epimerase
VRDHRNRIDECRIGEFLTIPMDFGSGVMRRMLDRLGPYDYIFNFAAVKHVRSEKNVFSLLHMLDNNVVKQARFLEWLAERNDNCRYFSVSTDKAANPVSMMGATKRIMEGILFARRFAELLRVTSARFANVAFSNGSLLASFLTRLQKRQPLAVPSDTRRYFVSLREAGEICLLAGTCAPAGQLLIPRLRSEVDLVDLQTIAVKTLEHYGFVPRLYRDADLAKGGLSDCEAYGNYPLLITSPDTSGEKAYEEFVGRGENAVDVGFVNLMAVAPTAIDEPDLFEFVDYVQEHIQNPDLALSKQELIHRMRELIPVFEHVHTEKCLDDRM